MKKRIEWVDIAKTIGIFLVIANHFGTNFGNEKIVYAIAAFHMPLFFLLGGVTLRKINSRSELVIYIKKRIKTILAPYLLWALLYCNDFTVKNMLKIVYANNRTLGISLPVLWFLPCMFTAYIFSLLIISLNNKVKMDRLFFIWPGLCWGIGYVITFGKPLPALGYPFSIDVAIIAAGFMLIGYRIKDFFENFMNKLLMHRLILYATILGGVTVTLAFLNTEAKIGSLGRVVMALSQYGNFPLFLIGGVTGSVFVVSLSMLLNRLKWKKVIIKIGQSTILILAIHQQYINIIEKMVIIYGINRNIVTWLLLSMVVLFGAWISAEIVAYLFPNLAGRYTMIFNSL